MCGLGYLNGRGVKQDELLAYEHILTAADQGLKEARHELGLMYLSDPPRGIPGALPESMKPVRRVGMRRVGTRPPELNGSLTEPVAEGSEVRLTFRQQLHKGRVEQQRMEYKQKAFSLFVASADGGNIKGMIRSAEGGSCM